MEQKNSQKIEEKNKYFFNNKTTYFSIPIEKFEEILKKYSEFSTIIPAKNGYKLYGINNKFFKIFQDGSCYGFTIVGNELNMIEGFFEHKQTNQQIYNDDFAGLKTYWVEEIYEEIIYKLGDDAQIVFVKMLDVPRNFEQHSIYLEIKNKNLNIYNIKKIYSKDIDFIFSFYNIP